MKDKIEWILIIIIMAGVLIFINAKDDARKATVYAQVCQGNKMKLESASVNDKKIIIMCK